MSLDYWFLSVRNGKNRIEATTLWNTVSGWCSWKGFFCICNHNKKKPLKTIMMSAVIFHAKSKNCPALLWVWFCLRWKKKRSRKILVNQNCRKICVYFFVSFHFEEVLEITPLWKPQISSKMACRTKMLLFL